MSPPPLTLDQEQANRLLGYIQAYRRYALTQRMPSAERNLHQRLLQGLQGRLIHEGEQKPPGSLSLFLTSEERAALKTMITDLRSLKEQEQPTEHQQAILDDLAALRGVLDQLALSEQKGHSMRNPW